MSEPERLLESSTNPLARRLLQAGLNERPDPAARARTWRACAGEGLTKASTLEGNAHSFANTLSRTLHLVRVPGWMRRSFLLASVAGVAAACAFSIWLLQGRPVPAPSHYAHYGTHAETVSEVDEKATLDRAEALLVRADIEGARRVLERYRHNHPDGKLTARADLLELQAKALDEGRSMDTE